jgi:hypothetical protein
MGMRVQPKQFEFFLASLMSRSEAVANPERDDLPREPLSSFPIEAEETGFWAAPSLTYFEQRLEPVGCDIIFDVALQLQSETRRHRFALSLWPDFQLGVLTAPDGTAFYPHFVRRPMVNISLPTKVSAIRPWSATLEEVLSRFGPPLDNSAWDFRRWMIYSFGGERWTMTFDLGLVQSVLPEPGIHPPKHFSRIKSESG